MYIQKKYILICHLLFIIAKNSEGKEEIIFAPL